MDTAQQTMNFLSSAGPLANTTVTGSVADKVMLDTGGVIMSRGYLYNIKAQRLSPKIWRLSLERANK